MSKMYPECPLVNHNSCKYMDDPKLCALKRKDQKCLKPRVIKGIKKPRKRKKRY